MKQRLLQAFVLVLFALSSALGQNAIIGTGFSTGWTNPTNITYPFSNSVGGSMIATFPSNGSGNRFWRMIRGFTGTGCLDGNNTEYGPPGNVDTQISSFGNVQPHGYTSGAGAWFVNDNTTGHNFIFKTENPCSSNRWTLFRVQGAVSTFSSQSVTAGTVYPGQSLTFSATLNAAAPAGQGVYLRWSTDNFATSTVVPMTYNGGSSYIATIASAQAGATYTYYYFTSGSGLTIAPADADFYTINLLNNSGANYTKSVASAWVTSGGNTSWTSLFSWAGSQVPPAGQPVQINHNLNVSSAVNPGNVTLSAGTLSFTGSGALTLASGSTLTVSGGTFSHSAGTVSAPSVQLTSGSLTLTGGIFTVNGGSLVTSGGTLTLNSGVTMNMAAGSTFTNNGGTQVLNGTVNFQGAGTVNGSSATSFGGLTINTGQVTLTTTPTVNGVLAINGGNFDAAARVTYSTNSILRYNTSYTVFREWLSTTMGSPGIDRPSFVEIANGATLTLPAAARAFARDITICSTCSLTYDAASELIVGGSWNNQHTGTNLTFGANTSRTTFNNATATTLTKAGSADQIFAAVSFRNSSTLTLNSSVSVTGTNSNAVEFNAPAGQINLNGKVLSVIGSGAGITVPVAYIVSGGSNSASLFNISGNKSFVANTGLTFSNLANMRINSGTFTATGTSGITIPSTSSLILNGGSFAQNAGVLTVAGTIQFNGGTYTGSVAPTYLNTSRVLYSANTTMGGEITQGAGGVATTGRPQDLEISNGATLTMANAARAVAGNVTICSTCSMVFQTSSGIGLGGNWVNNNSGDNITNTFTDNYISFVGNTSNSTLFKAGGATEVINNLFPNEAATLTLLSPVTVTRSTGSALTFSVAGATLDLNGFNLTILNSGAQITTNVSGTITGNSSSSLIIAANTARSGNNTLNINGSMSVVVNSGVTLSTIAGTTNYGVSTSLVLNGTHLRTSGTVNINGTLVMNAGSAYTGAAPVYGSSSLLRYTTSMTPGVEWNQGGYGAAASGRPHNIEITNGATLTMANGVDRSLANNFTICSTCSLSLPASGAINLLGNWTNNHTGSNITIATNSAYSIGFWGTTGTSTITKAGASAETFPAVSFTNQGTNIIQLNSDLTVTGNSGYVVALGGNIFDLNGKAFTLSGNGGSIWLMTTTYTIQGGAGSTFNINGNKVREGDGNTLTFGGSVAVNIGSGATLSQTNFGGAAVTTTIGASNILTLVGAWSNGGNTILNMNGTMIFNGGSYAGTAIVYGTSSLVRYMASRTIGNEFQSTSAGTATSGRPHNVEITDGATLTWIDLTRSIAGDLTICSTCSLTFQANSAIMIGGNWVNNHTGNNITTVSVNNTVNFTSGARTAATITKAGGGTEIFRGILVNKSVSLTLNNPIELAISSGSALVLGASNTNFNLNGFTCTLSNNGNITSTVNATISGGAGSSLVSSGTKSLSVTSGATLSISGNVLFNIPSGTISFNNTGGTLSLTSTATFRLSGGSWSTIATTPTSIFSVAGTLEMTSSSGSFSGVSPTYANTSRLVYNANRTIASTSAEWLEPNTGASAGVGRPQDVEFNAAITFTTGSRSCAGTVTISSVGSLTGVNAPNYTTIGLGGNFVDNNTSTTNFTRIGLYFQSNTATSLTKAGTGAIILPRFVQVGSGAVTINNDVVMTHPNVSSTAELAVGSGGLNIGNKTLSSTALLYVTMGTTGVISSSGGVVNIAGTVTVGGTTHRYSNVTVNVNGGTYNTPTGGLNVSGTAVFNVNNNAVLSLSGAYVGNSPVYSSTGSLTYAAALTMGNEWTATTAGAAGTGRPHGVNINANVTSSATTRAIGGLLTINNPATLTMGTNPTLMVGTGISDNNTTVQGFPTTTALVVSNNSSTGSISRGASPNLVLRSIETAGGSFMVNINNPVTVTGDLIFTSGFGLTLVENLTLTSSNGQIVNNGGGGLITTATGKALVIDGAYTIPATNVGDITFSNTGGMTIPAGRSLDVSGGLVFNNTGLVSVAGSMTVNHPNVTYPSNFTVSGKFNLNYNAGAAPTANWGTTGTLGILGVTTTAPTNLNQSVGSFVWQCAGQSQDIELGANSPSNISQTFSVSNTNGNRLFLNQSRTYTGSLLINGGRLGINNTSSNYTLAVGNLQIANGINNNAQLLLGLGTGSGNLVANAIQVNLTAATLPAALNGRVIDYANSGSHQMAFTSLTQTGTTPGLLGDVSNTSAFAGLIVISGGTGVVSLDKPDFIDRVNTFSNFAPITIAKPIQGVFNFSANNPVTFSSGAYLANSGYIDFAVCNITHSDPDGVTTGSTGILRNTSGYRIFGSGASITYNGSTPSVLGNALTGMDLASLTINNSAGVTTSADFRVPASLTLNGNLTLGNHSLIVNSASSFTLGAGRVVLNGDGDLNFDGTGTATLPNNLFSGTNTIGSITVEGGITGTLNNQSLTVLNGVNLVNGKLIVPATSTLTFGTSATWPVESNTSNIEGTTVMLPRAVGTGAFSFMGMSLAAGADNLGNVTVTRTSGAAGRVSYLTRSGVDCNWIIEADNQPVSGRALTVSWPSAWDNGRDMINIRFWRRLTSSDPWLPMGTARNVSATNPRTITFTTDHFSEWTTTDNNNTLPVTFVSVNAQRQGTSPVVQVSYTTAEERNVATYTLERSANAKDWEAVSTQQARTGTSNKYQMTDLNSAVDATWYYRVKSIDLDGTTGFSPVVVVRPVSETLPEVSLYPNPVKDVLLLNVSGMDEGVMQITITNAEGRAVLSRNLDVLSGTNQLRMQDQELSSLPAGMYMVQLALPNGTVLNKKMVK